MKVKDLRKILESIPDDFEVGHYVKEDKREHNLHPAYWVDVFHSFSGEVKFDFNNNKIGFLG